MTQSRRSSLPFGSWTALVVLLVTVGCSGGRDQPVATRPEPPQEEARTASAEAETDAEAAVAQAPVMSAEMEELRERAERHFQAGAQAYEAGMYEVAREHFDRALDVYLEADVAAADDEALRWAFNELVTRLHAVELDDLFHEIETPTPPLLQESIPPLTIVETELLRTRIEEMREEAEAVPSFTIPVPDPFENPSVLAAIEYLSTDRKKVVEEGLGRARRYLPMIEEIFAEEGVPQELAWIPLIESLFKPHAVSRARAVGMWQFMSGTARFFGLEVDWYVDERRDPVKATRTAARFIKDYYSEFDDWHLTIAAYNGGKGRVAGALRRSGLDNFWDLAQTAYLPRETRDFVPKILAAILIGTDPERYGLEVPEMEPFDYDEVTVDSMTDLRVIADCAGTTLEVIRALNPQLLKATTPNLPEYTLRVPAGTKALFEEAFAAIPPDERVFFVQHRVRRGETLSRIAGNYQTNQRAIQDLNNIRNPHRIWPGQELIIPVGQPGRPYRGPATASTEGNYREGEKVDYRVQRGDTLALIASTFRTSVPDLMRWNRLSSDLIFPGDNLTVYFATRGAAPRDNVAAPAPPRDTQGPRNLYTVRRGDSLYLIADRFGVAIDDLERWNDISRRRTIHPGDKLVVYADATRGPALRTYTVRSGDTPGEIAERFGVGLSELLAANSMSRRSVIRPGDELRIPGESTAVVENLGGEPITYTIRRGDTLIEIAQRHRVSVDDLCAWNDITPGTTLYPGRDLLIRRR